MRSLLLTDPLDSFLALAGVGTTFRPKPHYRCSERHGGQPPYRRKGQLQFAGPSKMGLETGMKTVVLSLLIALSTPAWADDKQDQRDVYDVFREWMKPSNGA
jgi:hypothetical protein